MDRRLDKEKLGLRSSKTLIHYQESQFTISIGVVEASPSGPKTKEEKIVIETPKLEGLRIKSVAGHTNFQQIAR